MSIRVDGGVRRRFSTSEAGTNRSPNPGIPKYQRPICPGHRCQQLWCGCCPVAGAARGRESYRLLQPSADEAREALCVTRKELLSVVASVKHFHHYLYGRPFTVRTDHGALKWLLNFKNPEGQVARWIEVLGTYSMKIEHRQGTRHGNADGLSRRPCPDCRHCEMQEQRDKEQNETTPEPSTCDTIGLQPSSECPAPDGGQQCLTVNGARTVLTDLPPKSHDADPWVAWLQDMSKTDLQAAQQGDPDLRQIIKWKETCVARPGWDRISPESPLVKTYWAQWEALALRDGVLYRRWESDAGDKVTFKMVVPRSLRNDILRGTSALERQQNECEHASTGLDAGETWKNGAGHVTCVSPERSQTRQFVQRWALTTLGHQWKGLPLM